MNTKRRIYNQIIESISALVKNAINEAFSSNDIFNQYDDEMTYKDDEESLLKDSYIFNNIANKILNGELVSEEEAIFYFKYIHEIPENLLYKLLNAEYNISKELIIGLSENNVKYKVRSKEELKEIIKKYSEKNPTATLNWIDTSEITNMSGLFWLSEYNGDISEWNVNNVTNMKYIFYCAKLFNQPIGDWDVSNVTTMEGMFVGASSFNQPIGDWNVSNVTDMLFMFHYAESFNQPIGDWDVSHVTTMEYMFSNAEAFNKPIGNWDVRNVITMSHMFNGALSFNLPISDWDVSNVKYMTGMFCEASSFNLDISNWQLNSKVKMKEMFDNCPIEEEYKPKI